LDVEQPSDFTRVPARRHRRLVDRLIRGPELGRGGVGQRGEPPGDIFWYLFGWTSWRTLTIDLGWSWDEAEKWLAQRGAEALLSPESRKS
jgi:hypothetical protein